MELFEKAKRLKDSYQFHEALELLNSMDEKEYTSNYFRLKAQCYYQDLQLPIGMRSSKALALLEIENDEKLEETLCLKGAVHKRKYDHSGDIKELYHAIAYYEKASEDVTKDRGYGAGNAVYLYYLLLFKLGDTLSQKLKKEYEERVKEIANRAIVKLQLFKNLNEWNLASLASLYLAIGEFDESRESLRKYKSHYKTFERQQFVTVEQMVKLFDVLPFDKKEEKLEDILSIYPNAKDIIKSVRIGKIGLALSGGGFRASLFHIGVLKRLAELNILRHVQVISTVSGGSIIGMYYYLELKKMLESTNNVELSKEHYVALVSKIEKEFSKSIKSNLRMSAFMKCPKTPLTEKLGELYQERLFDNIDTEVQSMSEIAIEPKVKERMYQEFIPQFHNFELENSVPRIIVNATLLNNGHNWQFTAKGMGENRYMTDISINNNPPYKFKEYSEKNLVTVGQAVAASSAVPVLFDPIELRLDGEIFKLSDGGLYDNMGLSSLIADECSHIIVSDGSGQFKEDKKPSSFRLDVLGRVMGVLMNRTREGEYKMAKSLEELAILKALSIFHMESESSLDNELQEKLAQVRTDLDAFHELESTGLVYAGYKICSDSFKEDYNSNGWSQFNLNEEEGADFKLFEERLREDREGVLRTLGVSSNMLFNLFAKVSKLINFKWKLKVVINKVIGLVVLPLAWSYVKLLNNRYLNKGKLNGR